MYVPVWLLFFIPGVSATLAHAAPALLAIGALVALFAGIVAAGSWGMRLLELGAKALPNWRIFNESTKAPIPMAYQMALGMGAFVALSVFAHMLMPR